MINKTTELDELVSLASELSLECFECAKERQLLEGIPPENTCEWSYGNTFQRAVDALTSQAREIERLRLCAYAVANAIHVGVGAMIQGTMMENEFRAALGLKEGEIVEIPKAALTPQGGEP